MNHARRLTASEAKASLGEVLGTLTSDGPVEITRHGRLVAIISAPTAKHPATDASRLMGLAVLYSAGKVNWRDIAEETGASFGELLLALALQNLDLPRVVPDKSLEQRNLFNAVLRRAASR